MNTIIFYHGGCRDGFASAYIAWTVFKDTAKYIPAYHGNTDNIDFNELKDKEVIFLDFMYDYGIMERIATVARRLTILDHHKTAEENFKKLTEQFANVDGLFDLTECGASLAAKKYLVYNKPDWVNYIKDRDLWQWNHADSKIINAYIGTWPFEFERWHYKVIYFNRSDAVAKGYAVQAKIDQYVLEVSKNTNIHKYVLPTGEMLNLPVVNAPPVDISELLEFLLVKYECNLVMGWFQRHDGLIQYSIRSRGHIDASEIAKIYGGGGHKNAAGFQLREFIFSDLSV